jgi:uncharacterized repeat protein (TIGR01451 family)
MHPTRTSRRSRVIRFVLLLLLLTRLPAAAAEVGYYDMVQGQGAPAQAPPITAAGHVPVQIFDLSAAELAGIDVLLVQNPSNGSYGVEYMSRLSTIDDAVKDGLVLVIHDRYVTGAATILPGGSGLHAFRNFDDPERNDIQVRDTTTQVTAGIGGDIGNATLDNGAFSSHGYVKDDAQLPAGAVKILTRGDPGDPATASTELVTFSYVHEQGRVIYSTIPLDMFLSGGGGNGNFAAVYAPNVVQYAGVLAIKAPDLEVGLTDGRTSSVPGTTVSYTLRVFNKGNRDAVGATVTDAFPAALGGMTWTCAGAGTATCTPSGSGNLNDMADIPAGDWVTYTATGAISPAATGTLVNSASAAHPDDVFTANNSASDSDTLTPEADLGLVKTGPASASSGGTATYTLTLTNHGPSNASGVRLDDPTPAGLTLETVGAPCAAGFPCTVGGLAAGASVAVTVELGVPSPYFGPDPSRNLASASATTPDRLPANNVAEAATAIDRAAAADLELRVAGPPSAAAGSQVRYRLEIENLGSDDAAGVTLAGPPPPGLLFSSAGAPCQGGLPCSLGRLAAGAIVRVEVTFNIPGAYSGPNPIVYNASLAAATADPQAANNTAGAAVPLGADTADLQLVKSGPLAAVRGQNLTYRFTVKNRGPAVASSVILTDTPPAGLTFVSAGAPCETGFPCLIGSLSAGAEQIVDAVFHLAAEYSGPDPLRNEAAVSASQVEGNQLDNTSHALSSLSGELADVSITYGAPATVAAGTPLTYTMLVRNLGPGRANNLSLAPSVPGALVFQEASAPCAGGFPCALGNIGAGAAVVVGADFAVAANHVSPDPVTSQATVSSANVDPDAANNTDGASTDVIFRADLGVTKTNGRSTLSPGLPTVYTIEVRNLGPSAAAGVTVTDVFPVQLTGVAWTCAGAGGASCTAAGSGNINDVVGLPAHSKVTYTAGATVAAGASGTLSNTAAASLPAGITDPVAANNSATDADPILPPIDLEVTKTGPASAVPGGANLVYGIQVRNYGPGNALGVVLADPTPAGLVFVSASPPCAGGFPCSLPNIAAGATTTLTATYQVPAAYAGPAPIANTATVSSTVHDSVPGNDSDTENTPVQPSADLAITKNDGLDHVVPGTPVTYTIVVRNLGPGAVSGAAVTDDPPAVLLSPSWTCTPSAGASCAANGSGAIADAASLQPGATATYRLTATVDPAASAAVVNQATVAVPAGFADPVPGNNQASDTSGLARVANLEVTKSNGLTEVVPGTALTYLVTVRNQGPSNVSGVTVTDTFPAALTGIGWTCTAAGGATCGAAAGSGSLSQTVGLPAGGSLTYTIGASVLPSATGILINTFTATLPAGVTDPDGFSSATDQDPLVRRAELELAKVGPASVERGALLTYTLTLANHGPSDADVVLTDPTPLGLSLEDVSAPCASGFPCAVSGLASDAELVLTVNYRVPADYSGADPIVNRAAARSDAADADPSDNLASSATPVGRTGVADLEVIKTAPAVAAAGSTVTYTLVVVNHGPDDARGVLLSESMPAGLTFHSAGAPCAAGFDCVLGNLPAGARAVVEATYTIPAGYSGPSVVVNTASVTGSTTDPVAGNNSDSASTTLVGSAADLALKKTGPTVVARGADLVVVLEIEQRGPGAATNVWLDDPTPAGLTFVSASAPCQGGFPCFLNSLAPGASLKVTATFHVPASYAGPNPIVNLAGVDGNELDPHGENNTARLLTGVGAEAADLEVTKKGPATVVAGSLANYTLTLRNLGPGKAAGVVLADPAPAGTAFVAASGPCAAGFPCSLGDLPAGSALVLSASYRVGAGMAAGTTVSNTATASTGSVDYGAANSSATVSSTSQVSADLSITKTDGVETIAPGSTVSYTIVASNAGPSNASGTTVTDDFPASITGVAWTCTATLGSSCGAANGNGNLNRLVDLAAGGSVTFTATGTIDPGASGTLSNTATLTRPSAVPDPNPANNSATDADTLAPRADLRITKASGGGGTVIPGGQVSYSIEVSNDGPSHVTGATVTDSFPAAVSSVVWTCTATAGSSCAAGGTVGILDGVNLRSGGKATYSVTATVNPALTTNLVNTATVGVPAGVTDPNPANNSATDTAAPAPRADLSIVKTDGQATAVPGTQVVYTITVGNAGPSTATGATVTDNLPAALSGATWSCAASGGGSCTAAGAGNILDTVNLPPGAAAVYTLTATLAAGATGTLVNIATVGSPAGVADPNTGNNGATDTDTLTPQADVAIAKTIANVAPPSPGERVVYTLTVTNAGPSAAGLARVADNFPAPLGSVTWTCQASPGATCPAPAGSGNIDALVGIPVGGEVVFVATATVLSAPPELLVNTATASLAGDPNSGNNNASASIRVDVPLFKDGFESGNTNAWSLVSGGLP